jgi:hypothetical protein
MHRTADHPVNDQKGWIRTFASTPRPSTPRLSLSESLPNEPRNDLQHQHTPRTRARSTVMARLLPSCRPVACRRTSASRCRYGAARVASGGDIRWRHSGAPLESSVTARNVDFGSVEPAARATGLAGSSSAGHVAAPSEQFGWAASRRSVLRVERVERGFGGGDVVGPRSDDAAHSVQRSTMMSNSLRNWPQSTSQGRRSGNAPSPLRYARAIPALSRCRSSLDVSPSAVPSPPFGGRVRCGGPAH